MGKKRIWLIAAVLLFTAATAFASADYDRTKFHWTASSHKCRNTRSEILIEGPGAVEVKTDTKGCKPVSGKWISPYSGAEYEGKSSKIQLEHVVAFHWAWEHGLSSRSFDEQLRYYNDESNMIGLYGPENASKSDQGPCEWRPPSKMAWCEYALTFVKMVVKYDLLPSECDFKAVWEMLATCPVEWSLQK